MLGWNSFLLLANISKNAFHGVGGGAFLDAVLGKQFLTPDESLGLLKRPGLRMSWFLLPGDGLCTQSLSLSQGKGCVVVVMGGGFVSHVHSLDPQLLAGK